MRVVLPLALLLAAAAAAAAPPTAAAGRETGQAAQCSALAPLAQPDPQLCAWRACDACIFFALD